MRKSRCGRIDGDEYCGDIMMSLQDFEAWENAESCDDEGVELCEDKDEEWCEDEDEEGGEQRTVDALDNSNSIN